jgi:hypothetical protein
MNENINQRPSEQDGKMAAVSAHELTAVAGGTEYGDGGCATMWPRDPRTGVPVRPKQPWEYGLLRGPA